MVCNIKVPKTMGMLFIKFIGLIAIGAGAYFTYQCMNQPPPPVLNPHEWWGLNELKGKLDHTVRPFKIKFEESAIKDLKARLKNPRSFVPPLEGVAFEYGFNTAQLKTWTDYWADQYPFAEREKFLNQFPQFKTYIQGIDIHFIRVKPQVPAGVKVVPLLLIHGWPGSVREFYEAIPLLTKQRAGYDFVFEVIAPSLPGYGFSEASVRPGLSAYQAGVIFRNLMHRLGHKKFYVQGGDWGSLVGSSMATLYPEDVLGYHTNLPSTQNGCSMLKTMIGAWIPSLIVEEHLADRIYPFADHFSYLLEESGYFHLQTTKPDTVGVALTDSPTGLLAYILEKFSSWTRRDHKTKPDGGLSYRFTKDQLIDNLMMYWIPNSITTSMRLYAESMSSKNRGLNIDSYPTEVPVWALQAKHEITYQPPSILRTKYKNLLNATVLDDGGHFLAFELPTVFVDDVFKAVKAFMEWHTKSVKSEL